MAQLCRLCTVCLLLLGHPALAAPGSSDARTQAIGVANQLLASAIAVQEQCNTVNQISTQYTQLAMGSTLAKQPTAPFNADGSLGTADASPNPANPINGPQLAANAGITLNRVISANDLGGLLTFLQGVAALCAGNAVAANGAAPQLLSKIVGQ